MPLDVCPSCGQSLFWCGESGVCVAKKVVFELSKRFHVEVRDDEEDDWTFLCGADTDYEARAGAWKVTAWRFVRVVDAEVS